jgi:hypothetical protein
LHLNAFHVIIYAMKRSVAAASLATSLALGAAGCGPTPERTPDPDVQKAFETTTQFWQSKGINLLGKHAVKLVEIREPGDVYTCHSNKGTRKITPTSDLARYCGPTNTVIISKQAYDEELRVKTVLGVSPEHFAQLIISHEVGHDIQDRRPRLKSPSGIQKELSADCIGSMASPGIPEVEAQSMLVGMGDHGYPPVDQRQGTDRQRFDAFKVGQLAHGDLALCAPSAFAQS